MQQEYSPEIEQTIQKMFKKYTHLGKLLTYETLQLVVFKTQSGTNPFGFGIYEVKAKFTSGDAIVKFEIIEKNQSMSVRSVYIASDIFSFFTPNKSHHIRRLTAASLRSRRQCD